MSDISDIQRGTSITKDRTIEGNIAVIAGGQEPAYFHNQANREGNIITISASGAYAGFVSYFDSPIFASDCNTIKSKDENAISTKLIFLFIKALQPQLYELQRGQAQPHVYADDLGKIKIPLPPKNVQEKIVAEIEALEHQEKQAKDAIEELNHKIIAYANLLYKEHGLYRIGTLCENPSYGANVSAIAGNPQSDYRYIRITDINENGKLNNDWKTAEKIESKYILKEGDFLFARSGATAGKTFLYKDTFGKALYAGYLIKFETKKDRLLPEFLDFVLKGEIYKNWVLGIRSGTAQPNINAQQYSAFEIPLPSLQDQQQIVAKIEEIEVRIAVLENQLESIPQQKEAVLRKHL